MANELIVLAAFGGIQTAFHTLHKFNDPSHPLLYKVTHKPWIVWFFHPAVVHTVQDYGIHFVIYSGAVISAH